MQAFRAQDYEEILTLRVALEGLSARLAAERATASDFARMEAILAEFAAGDEVDHLAHLDVEFHAAVVAAARHERLAQSWGAVRWPFEALLIPHLPRLLAGDATQGREGEPGRAPGDSRGAA